jgi:hypothetical protein
MTTSTRRVLGLQAGVLCAAFVGFAIGAAVRTGQAATPQGTAPAASAPQESAGGDQPARGGRGRGGRGGGGTGQGRVMGASGEVIGYTDLAEIPGTPWRIHDAVRPHPRVVTPGATPGAPPADAIILFDGTDLSRWAHVRQGQVSDATWPVRDGYFEVGDGSIVTREAFGDIQLHLEFATPNPARGASQDRGNSGVILMGRYEVQLLDSYENLTYADGQAAAIYGEYPPLVNVARRPGEWQTYDIVFEAPQFNDATLVAPAYVTVFWNGVLVHHRRPVMGSTSATRTQHAYTAHDPELPFTLQDHSHPVRFRNIWVRRLAGYDQPEQ